MKYKIIRGTCNTTVENKVQAYLNEGWLLHGSLCTCPRGAYTEYAQAVVK